MGKRKAVAAVDVLQLVKLMISNGVLFAREGILLLCVEYCDNAEVSIIQEWQKGKYPEAIYVCYGREKECTF